MPVETAEREGAWIVLLSGVLLSPAQFNPLKEQIDLAVQKGHRSVIVDLAGTEQIVSAVLGILVSARSTLEGKGGELVLTGLTDRVRSIFEQVRFSDLFGTYDTVDLAVQAMSSRSGQ